MLLAALLPALFAQTSRADPPLRDLFGASVALVGDLDGGGQPDLAIGDPVWNDSARERGRVWIVSTESGRALSVITPESAGRSFGWTLCAIGDVDGGGKADLAVGEMRWRAWPGGSEPRATVSVVSLETKRVLRHHEVGASGFVKEWHSFGPSPSIVNVGDWDGDGVADYAVGEILDGPEQRPALVDVISGKTNARLLVVPPAAGKQRVGVRLFALPDLDGDGVGDLAVSSLPWLPEDSGTKSSLITIIGSRDRAILHVLSPDHESAWFGASMCAAGDVDEDGKADLWIGEPYAVQSGGQLPSGIQLWSTKTWTKIGRVMPWPSSMDDAHERFGSVLLSLRESGFKGPESVLATDPDAFDGQYVLAREKGDPRVITSIRGQEDASGVGVCGCMIGDVDGDGVRDFAFGGVTWRGAVTGVVTIWSVAKQAVLSEITLRSVQVK